MNKLKDLIEKCGLEIHIGTVCKQIRDWNYLDTIFMLDSEEYASLCKLVGVVGIISPSQLMKKFDESRGKEFTMLTETTQCKVEFDFNENYEPIFVVLDTWTDYD